MNSADDITSFLATLGFILIIATCIVLALLMLTLSVFLLIYVIFECIFLPIFGRHHEADLERGHSARIVTYHAIIPNNVPSPTGDFNGGDLHETEEKHGLMKNVIERLLPRLLVRHGNGSSLLSSRECAICLCDYLTGEECKVFPICKHTYHADCIDPWLKNHLTCPVCRKGLLDS